MLHPWDVTPPEAVRIQEVLRKKIRLSPPQRKLKTVAAADAAYSRTEDLMVAAVCVFTYPDLLFIESAASAGKVTFPYIPGLFTFREGPTLLKAFSRLKKKPDLVLIDGQGIAHERSMGIASHIGLLLDLPSIGCAKSRLFGEYGNLSPERGSSAPLMHTGRPVGMVLRTRSGVKPVFVSPGHKMDLPTSAKVVLSLCQGYRIPEPLRRAHITVNALRRENGAMFR